MPPKGFGAQGRQISAYLDRGAVRRAQAGTIRLCFRTRLDGGSKNLEQPGGAHTPTDAHRHDAVSSVAPLTLD
jgi:hypothetical protein